MKTPEEIKKMLKRCSNADCGLCMSSLAEALEYIQQLENHIGELTEKVAQLEKERNALLADLRDADMLECAHCTHYIPVGVQCEGEGDCLECDLKNCVCKECLDNSNWKWRGIKYWIAMHWKTHIWPSRVNTQRSDRTGGWSATRSRRTRQWTLPETRTRST